MITYQSDLRLCTSLSNEVVKTLCSCIAYFIFVTHHSSASSFPHLLPVLIFQLRRYDERINMKEKQLYKPTCYYFQIKISILKYLVSFHVHEYLVKGNASPFCHSFQFIYVQRKLFRTKRQAPIVNQFSFWGQEFFNNYFIEKFPF